MYDDYDVKGEITQQFISCPIVIRNIVCDKYKRDLEYVCELLALRTATDNNIKRIIANKREAIG